jgi:hypothetical protein
MIGVRLEVTVAVLNHISSNGGGIAGVCQRHDWTAEKRSALDVWGAHAVAAAAGQLGHGSGDGWECAT